MPEDLDQLLAAWGATQRLSQPTADRIRARITEPAQPVTLSVTWWTGFHSRIAGTIARSSQLHLPAA